MAQRGKSPVLGYNHVSIWMLGSENEARLVAYLAQCGSEFAVAEDLLGSLWLFSCQAVQQRLQQKLQLPQLSIRSHKSHSHICCHSLAILIYTSTASSA